MQEMMVSLDARLIERAEIAAQLMGIDLQEFLGLVVSEKVIHTQLTDGDFSAPER